MSAAEDLLSGCTCEGCGEWFEDVLSGRSAPGYPRRCASCEPAGRASPRKIRPRTVPCPGCARKFRSHGAMMWHRKAKEH